MNGELFLDKFTLQNLKFFSTKESYDNWNSRRKRSLYPQN